MSSAIDTDTTIVLVRLTIRERRQLVDAMRDRGGDAFRAIAEAFAEDIEVLERALDALVEARDIRRGAR